MSSSSTCVLPETFPQRLELRFEAADLVDGGVHSVNLAADVAGELELLFEVPGGNLDARVREDFQSHGLRFPLRRQPNLVLARQDQRAVRPGPGVEGPRDLDGVLIAQVPDAALHPRGGRDRLLLSELLGPLGRLFELLFLDT
jgi:hypothetical protein